MRARTLKSIYFQTLFVDCFAMSHLPLLSEVGWSQRSSPSSCNFMMASTDCRGRKSCSFGAPVAWQVALGTKGPRFRCGGKGSMHVGTREELIVTLLQRTEHFAGLWHGGRKHVEQGGIQFHPHIRQSESQIRRFPARSKTYTFFTKIIIGHRAGCRQKRRLMCV